MTPSINPHQPTHPTSSHSKTSFGKFEKRQTKKDRETQKGMTLKNSYLVD